MNNLCIWTIKVAFIFISAVGVSMCDQTYYTIAAQSRIERVKIAERTSSYQLLAAGVTLTKRDENLICSG